MAKVDFHIYNSAGCDLGIMTADEVAAAISRGTVEPGDKLIAVLTAGDMLAEARKAARACFKPTTPKKGE